MIVNALDLVHAATEPTKSALHQVFDSILQKGRVEFKVGNFTGSVDPDEDDEALNISLPGLVVNVEPRLGSNSVWFQHGHEMIRVPVPAGLSQKNTLQFLVKKFVALWSGDAKLQGILAGHYATLTLRGSSDALDNIADYAKSVPGLHTHTHGLVRTYLYCLLKIDSQAKAVYDDLVTKISATEVWNITAAGREMQVHLLSNPRDRDLYFKSVLRSAARTRQATAAAEPTGGHLEHLWDELTRRGSFKFKIDGCEVEAKLDHRTGVLRAVTGKQYPAYNVSVIAGSTLSYFRAFYRMSEDVVEIDGSDDSHVRLDVIEHAASLSDLIKKIALVCRNLMQVGK